MAGHAGKTTLLRDVTGLLAEGFKKRMVVVDTSNEIGGDGTVPHSCIGRARRMPVVHKSCQHEVLQEAVQNHNPEVCIWSSAKERKDKKRKDKKRKDKKRQEKTRKDKKRQEKTRKEKKRQDKKRKGGGERGKKRKGNAFQRQLYEKPSSIDLLQCTIGTFAHHQCSDLAIEHLAISPASTSLQAASKLRVHTTTMCWQCATQLDANLRFVLSGDCGG